MGGKELRGLAPAGHDVEEPVGHARGLQRLRHQQRDFGAGRRRLDHDRVADRQRRGDFLNEEIGGPVERGDRGHHAVGHARREAEAAGACRGHVERQHFAHEVGYLRGAGAHECAYAFGLEGRGPARLADEANKRADQFAFDLVDDVGRGQQPLDPLGGGGVLMLEECRMGVLDRGVDDLGVGLDDLRGHGLVDRTHERREAGFELHRPADPRHQLRYGHRCPRFWSRLFRVRLTSLPLLRTRASHNPWFSAAPM